MPTSLWSKIKTKNVLLPDVVHQIGLGHIASIVKDRLMALSICPKINLNNVANFYAQHPKQEWDCRDAPNWAPPFPGFWTEWLEPQKWLFPDGPRSIEYMSQVGA